MTRARTLSKIGSDPAIFPGNVNITGVATATTFTGNLTGNASGSSGSCTGNAAGLTGTPNITVGAINASGISTVGVLTAYSAISADAGIDFSGAQTNQTGMTSETLDAYEEGTWTPVLKGSGGGTGTYTSYGAKYTKVGRIVHFECYIVCTGLGSISGNIQVGGLPFDAAAAGGYHNVTFSAAEGLALTAGQSLTGFCAINEDEFRIMVWDATTGTGFLDSADFTADGGFIASGSYFAD